MPMVEVSNGGTALDEGFVYFNLYWSSDGSNTKKVPLTNGTATFSGLGGGSGYAIPVATSVMNTSNLSTVVISTSAQVIFNVIGIKADGSIGYVTCINSRTYTVDVSDFEIVAFAHANTNSGYSMTITVS